MHTASHNCCEHAVNHGGRKHCHWALASEYLVSELKGPATGALATQVTGMCFGEGGGTGQGERKVGSLQGMRHGSGFHYQFQCSALQNSWQRLEETEILCCRGQGFPFPLGDPWLLPQIHQDAAVAFFATAIFMGPGQLRIGLPLTANPQHSSHQ